MPDRVQPTSLGLPAEVKVCLFDLDGVITDTAAVHSAAWAEMFDAYLQERAERDDEKFVAFSSDDYIAHVDGKRREDGVRDFLTARDIQLPDGSPGDSPDVETVHGLGTRKNEIVHRRIREDGVVVFDGSVDYVRACRDAGLATAVVSSSANAEEVLQVSGIRDLFDVIVDGKVSGELGLPGKPAPDTFVHGGRELGVEPDEAAVYEDALVGVEAGRAGGFAIVVGVDRVGQGAALKAHGADVVVTDLAELRS
ncbi:MAG: beta-phosphoglucomutase family hydrolase [Nocardioidaceae bacterium]|nr:beta-phosphoglucomutase family hydrolase [Nocardioidaceae bacterium]MDQ3326263.1 beta-phosphoglucomutase family hydrolase [Actinomycetota bacterium]